MEAWITETCGTCRYRVETPYDPRRPGQGLQYVCRRVPPGLQRTMDTWPVYPMVFKDTPACAEHEPTEGDNQ